MTDLSSPSDDCESVDDSSSQGAMKQGFQRAMDFLSTRGISLSHKDIVAHPPSPQMIKSVGGDIPYASAKKLKSPLQRYKERKAAEDKLRAENVNKSSNPELSEGGVSLSSPNISPPFTLDSHDLQEPSTPVVDQELSETTFRSMRNRNHNQNKGLDNFVQEIVSRFNESLEARLKQFAQEIRENKPEAITANQSNMLSQCVKDLSDEITRLHVTVRDVSEKSLTSSSNQKSQEGSYQLEIQGLQDLLKSSCRELESGRKDLADAADTLNKIFQVQPPEKKIENGANVNVNSTQLDRTISEKVTGNGNSSMLMSVSRGNSRGGSVSVVECAEVKIDRIKERLLSEFGWKELEEDEKCDNATVGLYEELERLKIENRRLSSKLKDQGVDIEEKSKQKSDLPKSASRRRYFSQSTRSPRTSKGSKDVSKELSSVSVSDMQKKLWNDGVLANNS